MDMTTQRKEIDKAKKAILSGIWKKRPTPYSKVCGTTSTYSQAMSELQNEKKIEVYSMEIFIKNREPEYYRWLPFTTVKGGFLVTPLLVKTL